MPLLEFKQGSIQVDATVVAEAPSARTDPEPRLHRLADPLDVGGKLAA
jgi:hypothetical protein